MTATAIERITSATQLRADRDALATGTLPAAAIARVRSASLAEAAERESAEGRAQRRTHPVFHWG